MVLLGVADAPGSAAAVVVDDTLVALVSEEQVPAPDAPELFPWHVVQAALETAGLSPADVDVVAVAGKLPSPLAPRGRAGLPRALLSIASPFFDVSVIWQAFLRHSGLGALAGDLAADWLTQRFTERGFRPSRLLTVDVHKALAEAAYRSQAADEALVVTLQPFGDGVGLAVHRGRAGQVDRLWVQAGFEAVHVHLPRALAALGLAEADPWLLDGLAARGAVDADLGARLARDLSAEGHELSQLPVVQGRLADPLARMLATVDRADAAATVLDNLGEAIAAVVRRHVRAHGVGTVALAGEAFDHPRLVARVAETEGVQRLSVLPRPGRDALAVGAAASQAGLAPRVRDLRLGPVLSEASCAGALAAAGLGSARRADLGDRLAAGGALVRARERAGPGRHGLGERAVLVRADDAVAIARVRERLGLAPEEEPLVVVVPTPNEGEIEALDVLRQPLSLGLAAPRVGPTFRRRYGAVVAGDGRVAMLRADPELHPGLHDLVRALLRGSGCGAVAAFPLELAGRGRAVRAADVVALYQRTGAEALQLGAHYVARASR
ncbi:MAG: hypothetical protein H6732_17635 [Alphaproteobacteria bacterium]|nr:hypothetical protein [Alphaproteobacteria bacterium]